MFRQKDVPGIGTIHQPLRHIDSRPGDVRPVVDIGDLIDRPAVDTHAYLDMRMIFKGSANFERTSRGLFRTAEKKERHPITGRDPSEFALAFSCPKTLGAADDLVQFLELLNLLVNQ